MTDRLSFEAKDETINTVLFNTTHKYRVPRYQRPYSWGDDNVTEFWNDLMGIEDTSSYGLPFFISAIC